MKLLISIIFILTIVSAPVIERYTYVLNTETEEVIDIDSDNEIEEENIELENKILEVFNYSLNKTLKPYKLDGFNHFNEFSSILNREIHTPPPELI